MSNALATARWRAKVKALAALGDPDAINKQKKVRKDSAKRQTRLRQRRRHLLNELAQLPTAELEALAKSQAAKSEIEVTGT